MDPNIITLLSINDQQSPSHRLCISVFTTIIDPNITTLLNVRVYDDGEHRDTESVTLLINYIK